MFSSVHNYYEQMVFEQILATMKAQGERADQDWLEDIACIALNYLPHRYVRHNVDIASSLNDTEREQMQIHVIQAIHEAILISKRRKNSRQESLDLPTTRPNTWGD